MMSCYIISERPLQSFILQKQQMVSGRGGREGPERCTLSEGLCLSLWWRWRLGFNLSQRIMRARDEPAALYFHLQTCCSSNQRANRTNELTKQPEDGVEHWELDRGTNVKFRLGRWFGFLPSGWRTNFRKFATSCFLFLGSFPNLNRRHAGFYSDSYPLGKWRCWK